MKRMIALGQAHAGFLGAVPCSVQAARIGVRDGARMFSADAVQRANRDLEALERTSHWQVVIETIDSLHGQDVKQRALENAQAEQVRGLYLLIAKAEHKSWAEPSRSAERAFPHAKVDAIYEAFKGPFHAGDFDKGLLNAVAEIRKDATATPDLVANAPRRAAPPIGATGAPVQAERDNGVINGPRKPAPVGREAGGVHPVNPQARRGIGMGTLLFLGIGAILLFWILGKLF